MHLLTWCYFSRCLKICAVSPHANNYEESLSTLRYADAAKQIKNKAVVNEDASAKKIRELEAEVAKLRSMLDGKGDTSTASPTTSGPSIAEIDALR